MRKVPDLLSGQLNRIVLFLSLFSLLTVIILNGVDVAIIPVVLVLSTPLIVRCGFEFDIIKHYELYELSWNEINMKIFILRELLFF